MRRFGSGLVSGFGLALEVGLGLRWHLGPTMKCFLAGLEKQKKTKNSPAARTSYRTLTGVMVLARGAEWKHLHVFRCNLSIRIRNNILNNLPMIDYESVRRRKQSSNGA